MIPRPEYPRPSFVRENWENLNGEWEFYIDAGNSGKDRNLHLCDKFDGKITVPFCPESKLSGVAHLDFMSAVWYAKNVTVTEAQLKGRVLLHIGACDYLTTVYVNQEEVGTHVGGYTSFTFDITDKLHAGENRIVINAQDDIRCDLQPAGKQSKTFYSKGCDYTRTTGIWQTVWLEYVPKTYLEKVKINATDLSGRVQLNVKLNEYAKNASLAISVKFNGEHISNLSFPLHGVQNALSFDVFPVHLWSCETPDLYDIEYTLLLDGKAVDKVDGYFGIRRIDIDGYKVRINGKSVFQRLILDQSYNPDGIYTAPSDEFLKRDIEISMALGFNGARMHEKVFEERFLYYADKMGYLIWGEYANWGLDVSLPMALHSFTAQWLESVERDYNHPSLIGWCPYNETWDYDGRRPIFTNISAVYDATKMADDTRPVIDTSGGYHSKCTDIYDVHDYEQDPAIFRERYTKHSEGEYYQTFVGKQVPYDGKLPYMVSEYGGILWNGEQEKENDCKIAWGYGQAPRTKVEFVERYCGLTSALLDSKNIMGFCYTQLTDVEQEQNGLYFYDRSKKFPDELYEKIRQCNLQKAAIEEDD